MEGNNLSLFIPTPSWFRHGGVVFVPCNKTHDAITRDDKGKVDEKGKHDGNAGSGIGIFWRCELRADDAKHAAEGKGFGTGAVVGALVGGPVGAAIGAGVGAQEEYRAHLGHEQLTAFVLTLREVRYKEG